MLKVKDARRCAVRDSRHTVDNVASIISLYKCNGMVAHIPERKYLLEEKKNLKL